MKKEPNLDVKFYRGLANLYRSLLDSAEADLDAERAASRKWELRLKWRRMHVRQAYNADLLSARLFEPSLRIRNIATRFERRALDHRYIAGPRGVLP